MRAHTKRGRPNELGVEAAGLAWLAEAEASGGAHAAVVLELASDVLTIERVEPAPPTSTRADAFGRALAHTHAEGAGWHGCPPDGWNGVGTIGRAAMDFAPADERDEPWGVFYARHRIEPYAREAVRRRELAPGDAAVFDRVCERLAAGDFDVPQPGLLPAGAAARLHGDLWSGNVLWSDAASGASLIDPSAHGGHAETDLAMLSLFGLAHLERVIAAYDEISPLADGWRGRTRLHQLFPLLVHTVLFGGGYGGQALAAARKYA